MEKSTLLERILESAWVRQFQADEAEKRRQHRQTLAEKYEDLNAQGKRDLPLLQARVNEAEEEAQQAPNTWKEAQRKADEARAVYGAGL